MTARRKFWGWGREDQALEAREIAQIESSYAKQFGVQGFQVLPTPRVEDVELRSPRIVPPVHFAGSCATDPHARLLHSYGRSFFDSARIFLGSFPNPPDVVALPASEEELIRMLDWCDTVNAVVIPWGGGSSVVAGVEPPHTDRPIVTIDMCRLDQVLEIDTTSQAARIQAGIYGPALEGRLKASGLTLRHFPQSFEFSTLGGWIATRGGGHYATLYTHIDEFVESLRVVTPCGVSESLRLPGSGAGPSPDRLFIGSEGTLGIITEAWMRLRARPVHRAASSVRFRSFEHAVQCVRAISQAHLYPANARLLDATEAHVNGAGDGSSSVLVLSFESADHPQDGALSRALEIALEHGGECDAVTDPGNAGAQRQGASGRWRNAFLRMPYFREVLTPRGIIVETFETAITWDRFPVFHDRIMAETRRVIKAVTGRDGIVSCRFTHVYPDGPAPYYTYHALGDTARMVEQCWAIKSATADLLNAMGGTITHHHAVGRDHRRWYDRQRPPVFAQALRAVKRTLDPRGMLNPGVLIDP